MKMRARTSDLEVKTQGNREWKFGHQTHGTSVRCLVARKNARNHAQTAEGHLSLLWSVSAGCTGVQEMLGGIPWLDCKVSSIVPRLEWGTQEDIASHLEHSKQF
jgi:hypothetical protein